MPGTTETVQQAPAVSLVVAARNEAENITPLTDEIAAAMSWGPRVASAQLTTAVHNTAALGGLRTTIEHATIIIGGLQRGRARLGG